MQVKRYNLIQVVIVKMVRMATHSMTISPYVLF